MTRYCGFSGGGVYVLEETSVRKLDPITEDQPPWVWGKPAQIAPGGALLARAILSDALGDIGRAVRLHRRYLHRVIVSLGDTWDLPVEDVRRVADEIETAARDMAGVVREAQREVPRVLDGRLQREQKWTSDPELTRNDPDKARRS